jgi:hypothetical protein
MGMPRSGTTIVPEVLMQNSNIMYLHEDGDNYPTSAFVNKKLKEGLYVIQKMPQRCLDLPRMIKQFPDAKFILMVRKIEAVIKGYSKFPEPKALYVVQRKRFGRIKKIYDPRTIWNLYVAQISQYQNHPNCFALMLEDFIFQQDISLFRLAHFLDLDLETKVTEFAKKYVTDKPTKDYPKGYHAWSFQTKNPIT